MKHPTELNYPGGMTKLASDLTSLRYDALMSFVGDMATNLMLDAIADESRGRGMLSEALNKAADALSDAWLICKPYMKEECNEMEKS